MLRTLRSAVGGELRGRRIAIWGFSTTAAAERPGGCTPPLRLIESLLDQGAAVSIHDPYALDEARALLGNRVLLLDDPYLAAIEAEAVVLTHAWNRGSRPDLERLRACMARPLLVDARAMYGDWGLIGFGFGEGGGLLGLGLTGFLAQPGDA
jgi:UDPglucose 6-dehydrogenase